jgi:hypothetical protein
VNPSADYQSAFGEPLAKDASIALPDTAFPVRSTPGPVRKQQFVIELVGPRTVPAPAVASLLEPHWQSPLGNPQIFVMAGADQHWRVLESGDPSAAYDSIALAWDILSPRGHLSQASAQQLWSVSESLAQQLQRRAIAMPMPDEIDGYIRALTELRESLDVGVNLSVVSSGFPMAEKEIWKACAALGMHLSPTGLFQWLPSGSHLPLFEVAPLESNCFSLGQVLSGTCHSGITIGFRVPCCPNPAAALGECFKVADVLAARCGGTALDEDDAPLTPQARTNALASLSKAVDALSRAGLIPGSTEALKLFDCLTQP